MLVLTSFLLACLASAGPTLATLSLHPRWAGDLVRRDTEALSYIPRGWERITKAPQDHVLTLRVGLKQGRFDELVHRLDQISDPSHSDYGRHLSKEEADELVKPHHSSLTIFNEWLDAHSVDPTSVSRTAAADWATLSVPVSVAESMLGCEFHVYEHTGSGKQAVRTLEYSLPRPLVGHIDTIQPTTYFGFGSSSDVSITACATTGWTPPCLLALYNMANYTAQATSENKLGVVSYAGDCQNKTDLQNVFQKYRPEAVGEDFDVLTVNNGTYGTECEGEGTLDVEYAMGMSYPTSTIVYAVGGEPPFTPDSITPGNTNEPYLEWVQYVLNQTNPPQTFTTSYADDEQTVPRDYAVRVCNSFAQLGARGVSLLFGSGDAGVGGGDCLTNDGTNQTKFQPLFPASWYLQYPEVAAGDNAAFTTGGGFSNYFARPSYQDSAVSTYLEALGDRNSGLFNPSGRGYPDIAAIGDGLLTIEDGQEFAESGTSASTPVAAAVIALLNDYLISQGKSPLGFANPWLYATGLQGELLHDIVNGSNPGCGTDGFMTRPAWDAVTGLGTPDFDKLRNLLA
ncbi:subtilisin-like protein [Stereum hirsutum FP-91666 SS1]|uniref:subtilisin-like protein n=1 Tax=Stereum hirsutum (strain FP-91666) TaxID=721885 RepID=UPI000444A902|nr:subtilisin-like protein [Stereum hirsutum FP-91666 SS1]EIM81511.1 subtilisin-like protein [Stereum hirsutum FP-91666 SS1]